MQFGNVRRSIIGVYTISVPTHLGFCHGNIKFKKIITHEQRGVYIYFAVIE